MTKKLITHTAQTKVVQRTVKSKVFALCPNYRNIDEKVRCVRLCSLRGMFVLMQIVLPVMLICETVDLYQLTFCDFIQFRW